MIKRKEVTKDGIFKIRITEEFGMKMKEVAKAQGRSMTYIIEELFNAEYEKLNSQKSGGIPAAAGA